VLSKQSARPVYLAIEANTRSPKRLGIGLAEMAKFLEVELASSEQDALFSKEPVGKADIIKAADTQIKKVYGDEKTTKDLFTETRAGEQDAGAGRDSGEQAEGAGTGTETAESLAGKEKSKKKTAKKRLQKKKKKDLRAVPFDTTGMKPMPEEYLGRMYRPGDSAAIESLTDNEAIKQAYEYKGSRDFFQELLDEQKPLWMEAHDGREPTAAEWKTEMGILAKMTLQGDMDEMGFIDGEYTEIEEQDWNVGVGMFEDQGKTDSFISKLGDNYIPKKEANTALKEWKAEVERIGLEEDHSKEIVISLFDASGEITKPWREAGYVVEQYDIQLGDDLMFKQSPLNAEMMGYDKSYKVVGIIAQPPCTCFSSSGARWWQTRHDKHDRDMVDKMFGPEASVWFSKPKEYTKALVSMVDVWIDLNKSDNPDLFYALENPVGRIAKETGLPAPTMRFHPHNFGDPYTKNTAIWGKFNKDLPTANVEPTLGSLMHKMWSTAETKDGARSLTPEGFAYSFFMANNTSDGAQAEAKPVTLKEGDQFNTTTGRITAPFPRSNYKVESKNQKAINQWLKNEYTAEAESRGDDYNVTLAKSLDVNNWSQADGDGVNLYLFDDAEGRIGSRKVETKPALPEATVKQVAALNKLADAMQKDIDSKLDPGVAHQNLTARRAAQIDSMRGDAERLQHAQAIMRGIAEGLENGTVDSALANVKNKKTALELVRLSKDNEWLKDFDRNSDETKALLQRAKITKKNYAKARKAAKNLIKPPSKEQIQKADLQKLERELIGTKIPGFFSTPPAVAQKVVDNADIQAGMTVLEPSAGTGGIADFIRDQQPKAKLTVNELNYKLNQVLEAKGYKPTQGDFLKLKGKYDRIVMNPPFEKGQDIEHVMHAYSLLNDGGRIVSIMSESPFHRSEKKYQAFREWIDELGAEVEELQSGDLSDPAAPQRSNVKGRILTLVKEAGNVLPVPDLASRAEHSGQAKAGGEWGVNGEWYRGGQFMPASARTVKGEYKASYTAGTGRQLIAPGEFAVPPAGGLSIFSGIRSLVKYGDDGVLSPINNKLAIKSYGGMKQLKRKIDLYNKGIRFVDESNNPISPAGAVAEGQSQYKAMEGKEVSYEVEVEDTGETYTVTVDAGVVMKDLDARTEALRKLKECI